MRHRVHIAFCIFLEYFFASTYQTHERCCYSMLHQMRAELLFISEYSVASFSKTAAHWRGCIEKLQLFAFWKIVVFRSHSERIRQRSARLDACEKLIPDEIKEILHVWIRIKDVRDNSAALKHQNASDQRLFR